MCFTQACFAKYQFYVRKCLSNIWKRRREGERDDNDDDVDVDVDDDDDELIIFQNLVCCDIPHTLSRVDRLFV